MERIRVNNFADIESVFIERAHSVVWCNVATIDNKNRPRSRILHPIWEGATGWILTGRNTLKAKHLAHNSFVSLAYTADLAKPVYVDCTATWIDDIDSKQRIWDMIASAPEPLGYDPTPFFQAVDSPNLGLLQLTPWQIEVADFPTTSTVWRK
ncbi:MAG: pyridoxamine 5'-phosphate oxidase family protein [Chloroflexi bacterium]|nr:MAG: pyridoxamine 5'-phosphate oxidase family protein [Chloroflexota bacterium]